MLISESDDQTLTITYEIIDGCSQRGNQMLVDSIGYSYTKKKATSRTTLWVCCKKNKDNIYCRASREFPHGRVFYSVLLCFQHSNVFFPTQWCVFYCLFAEYRRFSCVSLCFWLCFTVFFPCGNSLLWCTNRKESPLSVIQSKTTST